MPRKSLAPALTPTDLPRLYRVQFLLVDPAFLALAIVVQTLSPAVFLKSINDPRSSLLKSALSSLATATPEITAIIDLLSAWYLGLLVLLTVLLPSAHATLYTWQIVQTSLLVIDFGVLATFARLFYAQGRLFDIAAWGPDGAFNIGFVLWVVIVRSAFLVQTGFIKLGGGPAPTTPKRRAATSAGSKRAIKAKE